VSRKRVPMGGVKRTDIVSPSDGLNTEGDTEISGFQRSTETRWRGSESSLLDNRFWRTFDGGIPPHIYPKSVELFRQGYSPADAYYLEQGLVKLVYLGDQGREVITDLFGPGCMPGAESVILQEPHAVTAFTVTRCSLRRIPAAAFLNRLEIDPQFSRQVHRMHSRQVRYHLSHIGELACVSARHRLEQLLWDMAVGLQLVSSKPIIRLQPPIKQFEIAELIPVTPQYLSCLYKELEEDGFLQRDRGSLIIKPTMLWHRTANKGAQG
jgi:CRP/FNR family cyclic AMP-dependent transcriptional regulator